MALATEASARSLLLFHHDPDRTDDEIDAVVAGAGRAALPVGAAAEGHTVDLSVRL